LDKRPAELEVGPAGSLRQSLIEMAPVRFRDVVSLVCLCVLTLLALDGRMACINSQMDARFEPLTDRAFPSRADHDAGLEEERHKFEAIVADLQTRVEALQRENQRLNLRQQADVDDTVKEIQSQMWERQQHRETQNNEYPMDKNERATKSDSNVLTQPDEVISKDNKNVEIEDADNLPVDEGLSLDENEEDDAGENNGLRLSLDLDEESNFALDEDDGANDGADDLDQAPEGVELSEESVKGMVVERPDEEAAEDLEPEPNEDEEDDDEEEPVLTKPSELGFVDLGNGKHHLLAQVSNKYRKTFRVMGTKFISLYRAWEHAGWKHRYDSTSPVALYVTKPITKVPGSTGKMISQISKSSCIGGTKGAQLRCKVALANKHGCEYSSIKVSPPQYNLREKADCERFFEVAKDEANADKLWIGKDGGSYHGKNIKIYRGLKSEIRKKYGRCTKDKKGSAGYIMMEYIANPQLIAGRKFDLRTYLLIASTQPFVVFYHRGFIRRSSKAYTDSSFSRASHITNHKVQDNTEGHFWSFDQLNEYLSTEAGFPSDFMSSKFPKYVKKVTNFVFQAARTRLKRRHGAFMLFGLDWMIDSDQNIHFLEANGNPTISDYPGTGLGPQIWNDMTELLTKLHREPETLGPDVTVASNFAYGGWEIVFNEAEELQRGDTYNSCNALGGEQD